MDLNKVQLIWNITQDIELKQTPNGQSVCSFSIATNRSWVDWAGIKQEIAEFHNIVLWWKLSEIANQYLSKGKKVYIEWRLQTRSWEAQDWTKRYKTEIVWENMIMLWWWDKKENSWIESDQDFEKRVKKEKERDELTIEDIPF